MIKTFKKPLTFLMAFCMLFCFIGSFGNVTVNAATDRVSMYSREVYFAKYGFAQSYIYIQTKDNASNQQVYVHYNYIDGQDWQDAQATHFTTLPDGSKIWKASITSYNTKYAIKYVADGQTFWDNNNGNDYTNEIIGSAPITVKRWGGVSYNGECEINAVLKNYGYEKNVQVRYTENNWATYTDVPLSYNSTNTDGTENWLTKLTLEKSDTSGFQYCVYYQVNGQTYWANNFGQNYDSSYYIYH